MNSGKICVSLCAETAEDFLRKINSVPPEADVIELRFDCLDKTQRSILLNNLPEIRSEYLFTFRPREQGGKSDITREERIVFWETLFRSKRDNLLVDLEFDGELLGLFDQSGAKRIVSYHDYEGIRDVGALFEEISKAADHVKIAASVDDITSTIPLWKLLETASRNQHLIPIPMGEAGRWVRILSLAYGAYMIYAAHETGSETAPGQIPVSDLVDVYRVKELNRDTKVYGVIAGSTAHSMSPYIQNAAFIEADINAVFLPFQVTDIDEFFRRIVKRRSREIDLNLHGFAVTIPHKQSIMMHMDEIEETARVIGAVNTVAIRDNRIIGYNTDAEGFIRPLLHRYANVADARVGIIGAGGAARACVYSLINRGADVTVFARDRNKADALTSELGGAGQRLDSEAAYGEFDIIVNTTPLGTRGPLQEETVAIAEQLRDVKLVYDLVYNPKQTRLLGEACKSGCETLNGLEMLIDQAAAQFQIWTEQSAPTDSMLLAAQSRLQH